MVSDYTSHVTNMKYCAHLISDEIKCCVIFIGCET